MGLGAVRSAQKKFSDALEAYSQAERVAPQDPRVNMERGKCFVRSDQLPEALEDYRKAIAKDPENEAAWQGATEILQKSGRQNEASDLWSEGCRKNPKWGEK